MYYLYNMIQTKTTQTMKATETTTIEGTIYTTKKIEVRGDIWTVMFVTGKFNYVSVRKETNNPGKTVGREFKNIDEAIDSYKSIAMKAALMQL